jgi:hypothetical protein
LRGQLRHGSGDDVQPRVQGWRLVVDEFGVGAE